MAIFDDLSGLTDPYPDDPALLRHALARDSLFRPLFRIERLLDLARALPATSIEYNAGDLPIGQDPSMTPMNRLSVEDTIRRIEVCRSWMVLKNIEQHSDYGAVLERCLAEVEPVAEPSTGEMGRKEAFVFISSPGAVTPFHMDPEHNILMQIEGSKTFHVYPREIIADAQHEAYHAPGGHRNLAYHADFEAQATAIPMAPGDALYVPVKAPHRVKVGDEVSVSLSVTWRSRASDREARLRHVNRMLRKLGGTPRRPGADPGVDGLKVLGHRALSRLGLFPG